MKNIVRLGVVICLVIFASCSTKENIATQQRAGSSFKNAIVVKSVADEYKYVKNDCADCQLLQQSLVFNKKKPYDILELVNSKGDTVSYYFDISSFFITINP